MKLSFLGISFVIAGVLLFISQSLLEVEENAAYKNIIINEGIVRTPEDVAEALSREKDFDIEGAYRSGYTTGDIIDFLIKEPHTYRVTLYNGKYYENRITVKAIYPFLVSILLIIAGIIRIIVRSRSEDS